MNNMPDHFFVVSRYNEDSSWIRDYTENYLIINKGEPLPKGFKTKRLPNVGGNQFDIAWFICKNYKKLPETMVFVQAFPWDHCNQERFNQLIKNTEFTPLESYEYLDNTDAHIIDETGGYTEINNSWYIASHNNTHNITCKYSSYNQFMEKIFKNYDKPSYIRFSPGSQYLVPKEAVLRYPKKFWRCLAEELPRKSMTEAHIIERSLWYILTGRYEIRDYFKGESNE